ncbi:winged helix-turn-helix transcriptional regulator [Candidatus Aciduliprofundum boonei]|uniref:Uncharacterized protein n=1 Tax=Aciduliprofundum boonei (strain DSM 19572 / T469) TaxID=439481 RepID=B5IHM3_ACIB4|nr:winged helix-turn-helix transcriptional regulator [Candidatus Aciduliprofundum boonei]ADD08804.1 hypothetical protein Aboo_0995 [Aciduliprofundum boonei T469]EDY34239.1 hypothetical protein ABOONEI_2465 [Aciduliprofundum boonei T469]HII55424.1 PadR family transcriptional regulator [Candidatus Aciduliprofundum boonei]
MEKDSIWKKKNIVPLLTSLLDGKKKMSELLKVIPNYMTIKAYISELEEKGYVKTQEKFEGRKVIYVELTEKGRAVAEKLKEAEEVITMTPEELEAQRKRIHWIVDINTYADHITAYDIHDGKKETFNIWLKPNGKYLLLYCDRCHSYDCYHIDWAVHDPVIGPELKEIADEKGLKIKYLEDENEEE